MTDLCNCLVRIAFKRGLRTPMVADSSTPVLELIFATEFMEPVVGLSTLVELRFLWCCIESGEMLSTIPKTKIHPDKVVARIAAPSYPGNFRLHVDADAVTLDGVHILPLISDTICVLPRGEVVSSPSFLVQCFRRLDWPGLFPSAIQRDEVQPLCIREEYGAFLGAHIWDSSVVLLNALAAELLKGSLTAPASPSMGNHLAIDLGAGVGIGGLWLNRAAHFKHVVLTDKHELVPLMESNASLNGCTPDNVSCMGLDWACTADIAHVQQVHGTHADLLLASDVLYDVEAAASLCHVLCALAQPQRTPIYLAQRLRKGRRDLMEMITEARAKRQQSQGAEAKGSVMRWDSWDRFAVEILATELGVRVFRLFVRDDA